VNPWKAFKDGFVGAVTLKDVRRAFHVSRFHVEMANARMMGTIRPGSWLERELLRRSRSDRSEKIPLLKERPAGYRPPSTPKQGEGE
jgi:hypothetical protein